MSKYGNIIKVAVYHLIDAVTSNSLILLLAINRNGNKSAQYFTPSELHVLF